MKYKDMIKYVNELSKGKIKCKCGHSIVMPPNVNKVICRWCGNYVFKDKKDEFKYRFKESLNKK